MVMMTMMMMMIVAFIKRYKTTVPPACIAHYVQ